MASASAPDDRGDDATRLVYDVRREVFGAKRVIWEHASRPGGVPGPAKRTLAVALLEYWDVLQEHSDESVLEDDDGNSDWTETLASLPDKLEETVTVSASAAGDRGSGVREVSAIQAMHWRELVTTSKQLDKVAKDLGFSATTPSEMPWEEL